MAWYTEKGRSRYVGIQNIDNLQLPSTSSVQYAGPYRYTDGLSSKPSRGKGIHDGRSAPSAGAQSRDVKKRRHSPEAATIMAHCLGCIQQRSTGAYFNLA